MPGNITVREHIEWLRVNLRIDAKLAFLQVPKGSALQGRKRKRDVEPENQSSQWKGKCKASTLFFDRDAVNAAVTNLLKPSEGSNNLNESADQEETEENLVNEPPLKKARRSAKSAKTRTPARRNSKKSKKK